MMANGRVISIKRNAKEISGHEGCKCFIPGKSYEVVVKYENFQALEKDFGDSELVCSMSPRQNAEGVGGVNSCGD